MRGSDCSGSASNASNFRLQAEPCVSHFAESEAKFAAQLGQST